MVEPTSGRGTVIDRVPRILMDNVDQGVFVLDVRGRCVAVNRPLAQRLGRDAAELTGRPLEQLLPGRGDRHRAALDRALSGERCEYEALTSPGDQPRRCRVVLLPVPGDDGMIAAALGVCRDPPECGMRNAECGREEDGERPVAGSDSAVFDSAFRIPHPALGGDALGLMHDLRNLLTVIQGHLDLLAPLAEEELEQELRPVRQATARAAELSSRYLAAVRAAERSGAAARRAARAPQPVDLNGALIEVAALLRPRLRPGVALDVRARAPLPRVAGDGTQLHRLLLNLCLFALDAMAGDGRVRLQTDAVRPGPEDAARHGPGPFVCLTVTVPTTAPPGPDHLGLGVAAAIVEQHGGWLEHTHRPGVGTRLQVFLPAF